jgi:TatD DNase family protein
MIDSHSHLNFNAFRDDWREVLKRSFDNGVTAMINIGSNYKTSERAVNIAKEYQNCFVAVGLHPIHTNDEEFDLEKYRKIILENRKYLKAIGETGLDYFHQPANKEKQKEVFLKHLDLAKEFDLPLILHCRGDVDHPIQAYEDLLTLLYATGHMSRGTIHCFSANWQIAQKFLDLDFYIGFTGIVTYKNCGEALLEVVEKIPLEKMLIETDSPYLSPEPHRGERCEPRYVKFTAQKIAEIKKITLEEVIKQTTKNAKGLFKI